MNQQTRAEPAAPASDLPTDTFGPITGFSPGWEAAWDACAAHVAAAIAAGDLPDATLEQVRRHVKEGQAQLWLSLAGTIVTNLHEYPNGQAVHYWLVAGKFEAVRAMQPPIEAWARAQGATHASATGRLGWVRRLKDDGWRVVHTVIAKDLADG